MKFENKTAVITGGSRGIGLAIATRLAKEGANIAILYVGDESEGENANRHVVIGPDPKAKPVRRNGGYNNRGRGGRRPYSANRSEHNTPANPDRKPLNEGGATGLYGRIDK